jgi:heat shock protein HtpX
MQYVGLQTLKNRNNFRSLLLLCLFPVLVLGLVFAFFYLFYYLGGAPNPNGFDSEFGNYNGGFAYSSPWEFAFSQFVSVAPITIGVILIWFLIAYFANTQIISRATGSRPLERKENKRIYNLVENLTMTQGMAMPKINVIHDDSLNAFASGINKKTYTVTLTTGIINKLSDEELEAVIAHELSHIRNNDVRLLIVSIVFVGIFSMIAQISFRSLPRLTSGRDKKNGAIVVILLVAVLAFLGYIFASLMRFAISRNREYMADAGSVEMTRNSAALASALRKISADPDIESISRSDVAQLFIEHPLKNSKHKSFDSLFATHPPIEKRIAVLEQM